jgi:signal transduction histidine kinase
LVRGLSLGVLMVLAVATVLVFTLRSLSREKSRLLQGFASAQESAARELAADLEDRLRDVQEDANVIATLVKAARGGVGSERAEKAQTMLGSFRAMATVVRHYRSLALFGPDDDLRLSATDPAEDDVTAQALMGRSRKAVSTFRSSPTLIGPVEARPGRTFYLYSFPVDAETVVITIEAPRLLQSALRSVPDGRIVVTDPGAAQWIGCGGNTRCVPRTLASRTPPEASWTGANGSAWIGGDVAKAFGLPEQDAAVGWATISSPGLGTWRVLLATSAAMIQAREKALARQLVLTSLGLITAIGLVGVFIVRQQRIAAALAERLRNAERVRTLEQQLIRAEKLATTGVLAAGMAHEVGTPLGIIRARAEILLDQMREEGSKPALEAIVQQIDRISSTIREVLDFSRAQPVEMRSISAAIAITSTRELLDHRFRQQKVDVQLDIAADLPMLAGDANQLQQVLVNVILNACDACASGGSIRVSVQRDDDTRRVRWEVRDSGDGIPEQDLLAVFDPFFTTKKRGEGTGLGLPIAASIVRNHGGEISLTSAVGQGTTVTILWPISGENRVEG